MLSLTGYIIIGVLAMLVMPKYSAMPYDQTRITFLTVAGYLLLGWWLYDVREIHFSGSVLGLILVMAGWWFFTSVLSNRPDITFRRFLFFTMSLFLGAFVLTSAYEIPGLMILVTAALINSAIAIGQNIFKWEPFWKISWFKRYYPNGLIHRSPNFLGAYLVPHIFFGCYLAKAHSEMWGLGVALMLYVLWLTKCRAALISAICGLGVYGFFIYPLFTAGCFLALGLLLIFDKTRTKYMIHRALTAKDRLNYWKLGFLQYDRSPIWGIGFDVMKTKVPYLQRELNEKTKGKFLDPENYEDPKPRKMHNDYLQMILDTGFVGFFLFLSIITASIYVGATSGTDLTLYKTLALCAILINGLFFHTLYVITLNPITWYLICSILKSQSATMTFEMNPYLWMDYRWVGLMIALYTVRHQIYDYFSYKYLGTEIADEKLLLKCLRLNPNSSRMLNQACRYYNAKLRFDKSVNCLHQAIQHYDGDRTIWSIWTNLGSTYFFAGSLVLSLKAHKEALSLMPRFQPAQANVMAVEGELKKQGLNPGDYEL